MRNGKDLSWWKFLYIHRCSGQFASGVVSSVLSSEICSELHLATSEMDRKMKIANGSKVYVLGKVQEALITVRNEKWPLTVLVLNEAPFSVIADSQATRVMRPSLELDKDVAVFQSGKT